MYAFTTSLELSRFSLLPFFFFLTIYHSIAMMVKCRAICN